MEHLWKRIISTVDIGIDIGEAANSEELTKRIRIINFIALLSASVGLLSFPFDYLSAPAPWMVWEDILAVVFFSATLFFSKLGWHLFARFWILFVANVIIVINSLYFKHEFGVELFYFGLCAVSMVLFSHTEKKSMAVAAAFPVLGFVFFRFYGYGGEPASVTPAYLANYYLFAGLLNLMLIGFSIAYLQRANAGMKKQLYRSQQQAISSEKMAALGEMSSTMAHEINNPLMTIQLSLEQLTKDVSSTDPKKLEATVAKINRMVDRITAITQSLHSFARDGEGDPFVRAKIGGVIANAMELCRERFNNAGIELVVEDFDPELSFNCRPVQVSQVLLNLLNNSFYAVSGMNEKWVRIQIDGGAETVRIKVTDSGHGISPEIQGKIFQPFFTTKPPGQGTGLGLSVSKGIMEGHGGRLYLNPTAAHTQFVAEFAKDARVFS